MATSRKNKFPIEQEWNQNVLRLYEAVLNKKECLHDTFIYIFTDKSTEEIDQIAKINLNGILKFYLN